MANSESAKKRNRQMLKRRARNRAHTSRMRTAVKILRQAIADGDQKTAQELLTSTMGIVDSVARKGVIHRNAAARTKSRLCHAVAGMSN